MPLQIVTVPCLTDNYAWLLHDPQSGETAVVDVPEAGPIREALAARGWRLGTILITHHHGDHVDGVAELRAATGARVAGAAADAHRLPQLDLALAEGDAPPVCGETARVIDVPGHTVGHLAYHFPASAAVFTADSLMGLGCGRLFEGSAEQMWQSLSKLARLPGDTLVCSGHEYSASNAKFALTIDPGNPALISRARRIATAREKGEATVPVRLDEELQTNPFLRADRPEIRKRLGLEDASAAACFAEVRRRKDAF